MILQPHAFDLPWDLWKYSAVEVTKATHKEETPMIHWSDLELQFISLIGIQVRPTDYGTVWIFNWYFWLVGLSVSYQYINTATWRCKVGYSLYGIRRISPCIFKGICVSNLQYNINLIKNHHYHIQIDMKKRCHSSTHSYMGRRCVHSLPSHMEWFMTHTIQQQQQQRQPAPHHRPYTSYEPLVGYVWI